MRSALLLCLFLSTAAVVAEDDDFLKEDRTPSTGKSAGGGRQTVVYKAEEKTQAGEEKVAEAAEIKYRGVFRMREVRTESDWDCDPTALAAWARQFKMRLGLNAQDLNPRQPVRLDNDEIYEAPLLYMTGHTAFSFSEDEVKNLRRYLLNGGVLFVDDCLYGFPFGRSFMSEMRRVLPEYSFEPMLMGKKGLDTLFAMHYRIKVSEDGIPDSGMGYYKQGVPVQLIQIEGRAAVLYTAYDIGCYAEISSPPTPANPIGGPMHGHYQSEREGSYRLSTNIILYLMTH